ncbi:hypothetical protein CRM22_006091 [Opisthorchis felineus]|uniref:Uncharacterized protein n=1 Tax=Opisthorchis felineus TaxID=147828 RepID=A0A4S2LMT9_OPIFE|nr:hypothetical protein CRM22_006091 [Opisthorchis felineus]
MNVPFLKILFLSNLLLSLLLALVAIGVNPASKMHHGHDSKKSVPAKTNSGGASDSDERVVIAFTSISIIMFILASIVQIILFFALKEHYKIVVYVITGLVAAGLLSFAIATGVAYKPVPATTSDWLHCGCWVSLMAMITSVIFIFKPMDE